MRQAILAATVQPRATGATAQTQQIDAARAQAGQFAAAAHPRGADGRFITTGGTVQILDSNGKPVAEGQVVSVGMGPQGGIIQVKNPTTGATVSVPSSQIKQAPIAIATLSAKGAQGIPTGPGAAARAARWDAAHGVKPRSGRDALGQKASPALLKAYNDAYRAQAIKTAKANARKAAAAAKKRAAASKKASKKVGAPGYKAPKSVSTRSKRAFYK